MNPELYERYLAKKAKKLGISVEELKVQTDVQKAGSQEGKPLTFENGKWEMESEKPHNFQLSTFNSQLNKDSSQFTVHSSTDTVISSSTSPHPNPPHPGREQNFNQNNHSTIQPFNPSTNDSRQENTMSGWQSRSTVNIGGISQVQQTDNSLLSYPPTLQPSKFALIGYPLGHSLSKIIHEAGFKSMGINATYDILETPPDKLVDRIKFLKNNGYKGFNVTIPLKLPVSLFVNEVDRYADLARAINTVYINEDKTLVGYNTDVIGFKNAIPTDIDLKGKHAGILGTGGAAHAACVALSECGVKAIDFFTRSIPNSIELMNYVRRIFPSIEFNVYQIENIRNLGEYDMLVNTTPIGMLGKSGDMTPVEEHALKTLKQGAVVYDVIYNPKKTVLVKIAEKLNYRTITGLDMLIHQAVSAQKIWLGAVPDFKDMKISALEAL